MEAKMNIKEFIEFLKSNQGKKIDVHSFIEIKYLTDPISMFMSVSADTFCYSGGVVTVGHVGGHDKELGSLEAFEAHYTQPIVVSAQWKVFSISDFSEDDKHDFLIKDKKEYVFNEEAPKREITLTFANLTKEDIKISHNKWVKKYENKGNIKHNDDHE